MVGMLIGSRKSPAVGLMLGVLGLLAVSGCEKNVADLSPLNTVKPTPPQVSMGAPVGVPITTATSCPHSEQKR